MAFRPDIESLILAALDTGENHGYGVARAIEKVTNGDIGVPEGRLYPALHKLSENGFVNSRWEHKENRPSRKIYSLTESGKQRLADKRSSWLSFSKNMFQALNLQDEK